MHSKDELSNRGNKFSVGDRNKHVGAKKGLQFLGRRIKANPLGVLGESGNVFPGCVFSAARKL